MEKSSKFHYPLRYALPMLHPKGENKDLLLIVVPRMHQIAALNGCHSDAGHQGHDRALSCITSMFLVARNGQTDETSY